MERSSTLKVQTRSSDCRKDPHARTLSTTVVICAGQVQNNSVELSREWKIAEVMFLAYLTIVHLNGLPKLVNEISCTSRNAPKITVRVRFARRIGIESNIITRPGHIIVVLLLKLD